MNSKTHHTLDADGKAPNPATSSTEKEPWEFVNRRVEKMTTEVYTTWSSELTNLLIFASLFSAILTAFTVEAAKAVQVDPAKQTTSLLQTIVLQLNNITNPQANIPIELYPNPDISPHAQQIYLLYSVSLTLSLIAVVGGITCFQWLREFSRNVTGVSHRTDVYLQYLRHNSLRKWGVITLLNALPILLLVSLFLFFTGFIISQWESQASAAIPVSILVAIAAIFILVTSFLPALQVIWLASYTKHKFTLQDPSYEPLPDLLCPYRSPQAWLIHAILHYIVRSMEYISSGRVKPHCLMPFRDIENWTDYDTWWIYKHETKKSIYPALRWVASEFKQSKDTVFSVCQCFYSAFVDTCNTYMPRHWDAPLNTAAWTAFGLPAIADFEEEFIFDNSITIIDMHLEAFSRISEIIVYRRSTLDNTGVTYTGDTTSGNFDFYKILHAGASRNYRALLKSINTRLEESRINVNIAANAICYMLDHDWHCCWTITPTLENWCKQYQDSEFNHSVNPIYQLCEKLRETLSSKQKCRYLIDIFNRLFSSVEPEYLGELGFILGRLLVCCECDECTIDSRDARGFLKIIKYLVSNHLIDDEHTMDNILLYTAHVLKRSELPDATLIEETFNVILLAVEEHVRNPGSIEKTYTSSYWNLIYRTKHDQLLDSDTSTKFVLHPSRFNIPHTVPHPMLPNKDLRPIWRLIDNFNDRLKEIWESQSDEKSNDEKSKQVEGIEEMQNTIQESNEDEGISNQVLTGLTEVPESQVPMDLD